MPIGVEVKTVGDLLACITSRRFVENQLGGLQDCYGFWYLLVEGQYMAGEDGELLIWRGRWVQPTWGSSGWLYRRVAHWLTSMVVQGGARLLQTRDRAETIAALHAEYTWWTAEDWSEHTAVREHAWSSGIRRGNTRPPTLARMLAQLKSLGPKRAMAACTHFKGLDAVQGACAELWQEVPGVGKATARAVVKELEELT